MDLSVDVLRLVFSYLNSVDLCMVSGVCRYWRSVSIDPLLWKRLYFTGTCASKLRSFLRLKLTKHTKSVIVRIQDEKGHQKGYRAVLTPSNLQFLNNVSPCLEEIQIICSSGCNSRSNYFQDTQIPRNLKKLTLLNIIVDQKGLTANMLRNLVYLRIVRGCIQKSHISVLSQLPFLEHLCINEKSPYTKSCVKELLISGFTQLKTLDLSSSFLTDNLFSEIVLKMPNLNRLVVNSCSLLTVESLDCLQNLNDRNLIIEAQQTSLSLESSNWPSKCYQIIF